MFIEVIRAGGVAGLTRRAQVDTDAITDEDAVREWHLLVEQAKPLLDSQQLAAQQNVEAVPSQERDTFVWTVSVDNTTCKFGDSSITGPLRDLAHPGRADCNAEDDAALTTR